MVDSMPTVYSLSIPSSVRRRIGGLVASLPPYFDAIGRRRLLTPTSLATASCYAGLVQRLATGVPSPPELSQHRDSRVSLHPEAVEACRELVPGETIAAAARDALARGLLLFEAAAITPDNALGLLHVLQAADGDGTLPPAEQWQDIIARGNAVQRSGGRDEASRMREAKQRGLVEGFVEDCLDVDVDEALDPDASWSDVVAAYRAWHATEGRDAWDRKVPSLSDRKLAEVLALFDIKVEGERVVGARLRGMS